MVFFVAVSCGGTVPRIEGKNSRFATLMGSYTRAQLSLK